MGTNMIPDSWSSMNLNITSELPTSETDIKSVEYLLSESNRFLDFDNTHIPSQAYNESVIVPVHATINCPTLSPLPHAQSSKNMFEINFSTYNSYTTSMSRTDSSSSWVDMSMNVVPDGSSLSDKSYPFAGNVNEGSEVVGTDREARVLRYKEKRKNRKFEKTVRYASRKAYAEIRPRIKGRFAKRSKF